MKLLPVLVRKRSELEDFRKGSLTYTVYCMYCSSRKRQKQTLLHFLADTGFGEDKFALVQVCSGASHTWIYKLDYLSLSLHLSTLACLPTGLDYFPSSNDRIMSDMFKEVALAGCSEEEAGNETHTRRCTHIPDASLDSVTSYGRAGFNDVSVCQAGAEISLCVKRTREMRQEGFSNNSVITTGVRLDDRGRLMVLVNQSPLLDFREGISLASFT